MRATDLQSMAETLNELASTDTLTGLPNRRSFMHGINTLYTAVLQGQGKAGVVMMLDIDRFKRVNDTYGHATGDEVLKHIARLIQSSVRSADMPGRYGGEEFVVLQPHTTLAEGMATAERIRRQVEETPIDVDGQVIRVTISIGVARVSAHHPPKAALQLADQALYEAKNSGRNKVCLAEELQGGN